MGFKITRPIPLVLRQVALRALVVSGLSSFLTGVIFGSHYNGKLSPLLASLSIFPLLIVFHHVLRIWPRRWWPVNFELIYSTFELLWAPGRIFVDAMFPHDNPPVFLNFLVLGSFFIFGISLLLSFFFMIWNLYLPWCKTVHCTYDFLENDSIPQHWEAYQLGWWPVLLGEYTLRKRFSPDWRVVRWTRAWLAVLCLVAMTVLAYIVLIARPAHLEQGTSLIRYLRTSSGILDEHTGLNISMYISMCVGPGCIPYETSMLRSYDMNVTGWPDDSGFITCDPSDPDHLPSTLSCTIPPPSLPLAPENILITIDYTRVIHYYQKWQLRTGIHFGFQSPTGRQTVDNSSTMPLLYPGSHLYGIPVCSYKDTFANSAAAAFGVPQVCGLIIIMNTGLSFSEQYHRSTVTDIQSILPDPFFPSNDDNTTTLRLMYRDLYQVGQMNYQIEQDYSDSSVLNGFALLGGVWTSINGLFAAIFGSTLLLVLFGGVKCSLAYYAIVNTLWNRY